MSKVLAKVTGELDRPRGTDVTHSLTVPADWLRQAATIEFELPRNLKCSACDGGGCDSCGRAGAVSTRRRKDPVERVQVTLPAGSDGDAPNSRRIVVRIPERGALPADSELPRGHLMLSIRPGQEADAGVALTQDLESDQPIQFNIPRGSDQEPENIRLLLMAAAALLLVVIWTALNW